MIVLDASAVIEVLLRTTASDGVLARISGISGGVHVPQLLDLEVAQVLRRYAQAGSISEERGRSSLEWLEVFPLQPHPHPRLLPRIWELRENATAYDACDLALAEALGAPRLTSDRKLASTPGHRVRIELA